MTRDKDRQNEDEGNQSWELEGERWGSGDIGVTSDKDRQNEDEGDQNWDLEGERYGDEGMSG